MGRFLTYMYESFQNNINLLLAVNLILVLLDDYQKLYNKMSPEFVKSTVHAIVFFRKPTRIFLLK